MPQFPPRAHREAPKTARFMMFFGALAFTIGAYATFSNRLWIAGTIMAALALFLAFVGISWHRLGRVRPARRKFVGRITPKSDRHRRS